ncbi:MAG TPA: ATP-binding protein [Bacteroidota bacterium]|nr:ATP-binding protein [Bacteroidota bacterium]
MQKHLKMSVKKSGRKKNNSRRDYIFACNSDPKEVRNIELFLNKMNASLRLDDGAMYRLLLSCTEAVNNAILHGNHSDPSKSVRMRCVVQKNSLVVTVKDEGKGFDADHLADPLAKENLLKESGRGVFLMRSLMDEVKYTQAKTGLTVRMKLNLVP